MPAKRTGYSSYIDYYPQYGKAARRIKLPQIPKRPLRFQLRTLLRHSAIHGKPAWWLTVHRAGMSGRPRVGENELEARAVPHSVVPGYLTERLLYAALVNLFHFVPGVDFLFQSSLEGGRIEMGGLSVDFLFPILRLVINPLGPHHYRFDWRAKDEEQIAILTEMGYQVYMVDEEVMYNQYQLEEFLRRIFVGNGSPGGDTGAFPPSVDSSNQRQADDLDALYHSIKKLEVDLYGIFS